MGRGPLIILSGPSGSGKSTIVDRLLREDGWPLRLSVSATTRAARPREEDGKHYHFWSRERFLQEVAHDAFLEWAEVHGNCYGTLRQEVEPYREQGIGVILDIDVKGWEQVKAKCDDAVSIFLKTSNMDVYRERLVRRRTESEEAIQRRLAAARAEEARAGEYDYVVINDDLETALAHMRQIVGPLFERKNHA
ncbi:MAG: guanylate kinase [Gemmataceae bacterium]